MFQITAKNIFPLENGTESSVNKSVVINIKDRDDNLPEFSKGMVNTHIFFYISVIVKNVELYVRLNIYNNEHCIKISYVTMLARTADC